MASELPCVPEQDGVAQIGRELREARQARSERLDDAAAFLRIRPDHLAALENGDLAGTPGRVYAIGFLRSYGDHLGLDGARLVARLKAGMRPAAPPPPDSAPRRAHAAAALAALLLGSSILGLGSGTSGPQGRSPGEPPSVTVTAVLTEPSDVASAAAAEAAPLLPLAAQDREDAVLGSVPAPGGRLALMGVADGWIQVRSGDRSYVRSGILLAGQRLPVPRRPDLLLSASDGGSVELLADGASLGPAGVGGRALRDLPLPAEAPVPARAITR
jgi:cytoskeleton protein RodZ